MTAHAYSISHTGGRGAAIVGRPDDCLGIDLVRLARVSARHAFAILSAGEWGALGPYDAALRPALVWALKEAAAKATGAPARWFPDGLRIQRSESGRLEVSVVADPTLTFDVDWRVDGPLLCTWVVRRCTNIAQPASGLGPATLAIVDPAPLVRGTDCVAAASRPGHDGAHPMTRPTSG